MVDPTTFELTGVSHSAEMVREARWQRRRVDCDLTDWVKARQSGIFPVGLTALDEVEETALGPRSSPSHTTARDEVKALIEALKLPMDERGKRRAAARAEWAASADKPLDTHGFLAD
jgi:chromosome partitioning protein